MHSIMNKEASIRLRRQGARIRHESRRCRPAVHCDTVHSAARMDALFLCRRRDREKRQVRHHESGINTGHVSPRPASYSKCKCQALSSHYQSAEPVRLRVLIYLPGYVQEVGLKEKIEVRGRQGRKADQLRLLNSDNSSQEGLKEKAYLRPEEVEEKG